MKKPTYKEAIEYAMNNLAGGELYEGLRDIHRGGIKEEPALQEWLNQVKYFAQSVPIDMINFVYKKNEEESFFEILRCLYYGQSFMAIYKHSSRSHMRQRLYGYMKQAKKCIEL